MCGYFTPIYHGYDIATVTKLLMNMCMMMTLRDCSLITGRGGYKMGKS